MRVLQKYPYCAQTPSAYLAMSKDNFLTPGNRMYERNHNLVPELEAEYYELELLSHGKDDASPLVLTLDDLKKIQPSHEVIVTIACGGSKRS